MTRKPVFHPSKPASAPPAADAPTASPYRRTVVVEGEIIYAVEDNGKVYNPQELSDEQVRDIVTQYSDEDKATARRVGLTVPQLSTEQNRNGSTKSVNIVFGGTSPYVPISVYLLTDADPKWFKWLNAVEYQFGSHRLAFVGHVDRTTLLFKREIPPPDAE